jgi:hypothetical protein
MQTCRKQLQALAQREPNMTQAVRNVIADCRTEQLNPHGNIGPEAQQPLEADCAAHAQDATGHLRGCVTRHGVLDDPALHTLAPTPAVPLRRALSLTSFLAYHVQGEAGMGYDAQATVAALAKDPDLAPLSEGGTVALPIDALRGTTGREAAPTWWTLQEDGDAGPVDGERYLRELALGDTECRTAAADGVVVEVIVPPAHLPGRPLYKPCALDAFDPDTRFRPDCSAAPYGRTHPQDGPSEDLAGRPELVGRSLAYADMGGADSVVRVAGLPWHAPDDAPT